MSNSLFCLPVFVDVSKNQHDSSDLALVIADRGGTVVDGSLRAVLADEHGQRSIWNRWLVCGTGGSDIVLAFFRTPVTMKAFLGLCKVLGRDGFSPFLPFALFLPNQQFSLEFIMEWYSGHVGLEPLQDIFLKEPNVAAKLYVGNLAYGVTNTDLETMFAPHGTVQSAQIIMDRETGRSKGFGFVEMGNNNEAQAAIQALNGKETEGRALTVNEARPKEDRGGNRGNGGGNRRY